MRLSLNQLQSIQGAVFSQYPAQSATIVVKATSTLPMILKKVSIAPFSPVYSLNLYQQSANSYCKKECREISDKNSNCPFAIHYAEGSSLQGVMIADKIAFENYSRGEQINTFFGCTTKETNLFLSQEANGIFGLAPNRQSDLLDQMVAKHQKYSGQTLQFSLCLSSNGGLMTIGGLNTDLHGKYLEPSAVGKFNSSKNLYSLEGMHQIRIGQQVLHWGPKNYGPHGIFIDSGSTYTYFPKQTYNKFEKHLNNICIQSKKCYLSRGDKEMCYDLQKQGKTLLEATKELFPPLFFQLNKKDIAWPSTKYMLMDDEQGSLVCLGVRRLDRFLLGGTWMYDRDIVFDIKNSTISIYDNVKCVKDAPEMGRKSKNLEAIDEIQQSSSQSLSNILFFVGVFFTICSIIGVALLISTRLKKSKSVQFTQLTIKENENHRQSNEQRRTNGLIDQDHEEQILNSQNP